jgi:arginine metabolism regulation protein II
MELREAMSEMLTASVKSGDVDQCLSQVDRETDELESGEPGSFMTEHGPFGAFRISNMETEPETTSVTPGFRSPTVSAALSLPMTESIPNINDIFSEDPLMECLFWDFNLPTDLQHGALFNANSSPTNYDESNTFCTPHSMPSAPAMASPSSPPMSNLAPGNGGALLLHYKENVIRFFSPIYSNKTPWQIMHVPIAMETFAQLSLGEFAPSTKMCIFYSVLATSAFALRASSSQEHGGEAYALQAQNYLKMAIRDATSTPKKVKYKDMLIAFLCMATAWVSFLPQGARMDVAS